MKQYIIQFTILGAVLSVMILSGCASMSSMQTARTLEKGKTGFGAAGSYVNMTIPLGTMDTLEFKSPLLDVYGRYGVAERLDVGAKLSIIGTAVLDAKYQFLGNRESKLAGSAGLGLGYLSISSGDSSESKIFDIIVPTYFSAHPASWFSLYASPKYTLRINSYTAGAESGSDVSHWYGATGGVRFGKRFGLLAEYSFFANNKYEFPFSQAGVGLNFGI